jgi:heme/copper-type cytochrome/quinol oxidase subunit 2
VSFVIIVIFVFVIFLSITSVLNLIMNTTERKHWLLSVLLSIVFTILTMAILSQ